MGLYAATTSCPVSLPHQTVNSTGQWLSLCSLPRAWCNAWHETSTQILLEEQGMLSMSPFGSEKMLPQPERETCFSKTFKDPVQFSDKIKNFSIHNFSYFWNEWLSLVLRILVLESKDLVLILWSLLTAWWWSNIIISQCVHFLLGKVGLNQCQSNDVKIKRVNKQVFRIGPSAWESINVGSYYQCS